MKAHSVRRRDYGLPPNILNGSGRCPYTAAGQEIAKGLGNITEMIIQGIFPWCFTPELYAAKPEYIDQLAAFVRSRPKQPLDAFIRQSNAVIAQDALPARPDQSADSDHLRPARHRDLDPLRRRCVGTER